MHNSTNVTFVRNIIAQHTFIGGHYWDDEAELAGELAQLDALAGQAAELRGGPALLAEMLRLASVRLNEAGSLDDHPEAAALIEAVAQQLASAR